MHYGINFHRNLAKFHPAISTQSDNPIHPIITSTYSITVLHLSIEEAFIEPSTYHDWFKSVLCSYKLLKSLSTLHTRKAVFVKILKHVLLCFKISWTIMVISFHHISCQLESKKQRNVQRLSSGCHQVIYLYLVPAAGIGMTAMRPTTCFPWDHHPPSILLLDLLSFSPQAFSSEIDKLKRTESLLTHSDRIRPAPYLNYFMFIVFHMIALYPLNGRFRIEMCLCML